MDKDLFQNAKSIIDIYALVKKLRLEGIENMSEVNQLASRRKRKLIEEGNEIKLLNKVIPKANPGNRTKVSNFPIQVQRLSSGSIKITEEGVIVL